MKFTYNIGQMKTLEEAEEHRFILGNGLGGYMAGTAAFSVTRCDDGLLVGAVGIPNQRKLLVHRLQERAVCCGNVFDVSSQRFADGREDEEGFRYLSEFIVDALPKWQYDCGGLKITRTCAMKYGRNLSVVGYEFVNPTRVTAKFTASPSFLFTDKGQAREKAAGIRAERSAEDGNGDRRDSETGTIIRKNEKTAGLKADTAIVKAENSADRLMPEIRIVTDGNFVMDGSRKSSILILNQTEQLSYPDDEADGRPESGIAEQIINICWEIAPGECRRGYVSFAMEPEHNGGKSGKRKLSDGWQIIAEEKERREHLLIRGGFRNPAARELCRAADLYITEKEFAGINFEPGREFAGNTAEPTASIIAGYPLFGDWGRDTMISLPGCALAVGEYGKAKAILRTFLACEKDGLVPNLFPEDGAPAMYNTVDAALLLFECLYQYLEDTKDLAFVREEWSVLQRIISAYRQGTHHGIHMDKDGLILAGEGLDQVTWMDVCVNGVLPTPRHGKPVEVNAYWYNALCIMAELAERLAAADFDETGGERIPADSASSYGSEEYRRLAALVKESFLREFWMPQEGYLKDVVMRRGTDPGDRFSRQLRCNQIWALTMTYTMPDQEMARSILSKVRESLYTTHGLRTLSPDDPEYHGFYGGSRVDRDMAYHQGTIWVFPLGAYYRAVLRTGAGSKEAGNINNDSGKTRKARIISRKAIEEVQSGLAAIPAMLREGCAGQLPEIYDGDEPGQSKGCYAQAWSVGEILRVYRELEALI